MSEEELTNWELYPAALDGNLGLFVVDLAVQNRCPIDELSWVNHLIVHYEEQRPDGMPMPEQMEELEELQEWLVEFFEDPPGLLVGRTTVAGRREFFVYATEDRSDELRGAFELQYPDFDYEVRSKPDPEWVIYREFLYPTELDMQRIKNQRVVRTLMENGDSVGQPRDVDHFAYFPGQEERDGFRSVAEQEGFDVVKEEEDEERAQRPYGLVLRRTHSVDLTTIDSVVLPLVEKVHEFDGDYDGWGCPVVSS